MNERMNENGSPEYSIKQNEKDWAKFESQNL